MKKNFLFTKSSEAHIRNKISLLAFLASFFILYAHNHNYDVYGISSESTGILGITYAVEEYLNYIANYITTCLFFFISGFLFFRTFEINKLFEKYKSRLFSIVIPYLIWASIYFLYYVTLTNIPFIKSHMNAEETVLFNFGNWLSWLWVDEYYTLWFLKYLIVYIALAPVIWLLLKNHFKKIPTGLIALVAMIVVFDSGIIDFEYFERIDIYLVGAYIGLNLKDYIYYKNRILSYVSLCFIFFMLVTSFRYFNIVTEVLFFLGFWYALDLIDFSDKKLPWWTGITFFTYVAHDAFLEPMKKIWGMFFGRIEVMALVEYLLLPVLLFVVLVVVAWIFRKLLPKTWQVLTGAR